MRRCLTSAGLITTVLLSAQADAEWRCDCTTIIDSCSAQVTVQDTFVEVSAPAAQCARVDYFIDGLPFVTVAVDGNAMGCQANANGAESKPLSMANRN